MASPPNTIPKKNHSLRDFKGVNTQSDRRMIGDDEFAWLENVMPIGYGNLKAVPAASAALATLGGVLSCYYMAEGNIANVSYMYMFCTDGSCYQINLTSFASTTVGAAGTFSGTISRIAQWKNERIVIIDTTKGYFDWDGATLTTYKGAIASVTTVIGGTGFTNATLTTLTLTGGSGSSAAFSCTLGVNLATLQVAGTGYVVGDVLTATGGTFTYPCTLTVSTVDGSGAITAFNLTTTGIYTVYPGANPIGVTGGHGTAATFNLTFGIYAVTVTNKGTGYLATDVLVLTPSGLGAGTNTSLTVNLAINTTGTTIAVYASRVWFANNRTVVYSAPNSYNDFNPADLAGSFIMTDDTMRTHIVRLFSANNFLYIIGSNSINVISNVTTTTPTYSSTGTVLTPATTTFSNTNITPSVGTEYTDSVVSYHRTILLGVDYGFFGLTGATPQKLSDELDGMFAYIDFTQAVSAGSVVIYNILCLCFLVKYNDPLTGTARQLLCVHFNKKWFFASQVAAMTFIATASPDPDVPNLWATDGNNLYKLFSVTTTNIAQTIISKLWDMGDPLVIKQALQLRVDNISTTTANTITVSIDTGNNSQSYTFTGSNQANVINNTGANISMFNNLSQPIIWLAVGYLAVQSSVNNFGNFIGLTTTSSNPGNTFIGFHLQYKLGAEWAHLPY